MSWLPRYGLAVTTSLCLLSTHTDPKQSGSRPAGLGRDGMDLLWESEDANGFPIDPYWRAQALVSDPQASTPDPGQDCDWSDYKPLCTQELTDSDLPPAGKWIPGRFTKFKPACPLRDHGRGTPGSHVNWCPVSYKGSARLYGVVQKAFERDRDLELHLTPRAGHGLTNGNRDAGQDLRGEIGLEFFADETVSRFRAPWWRQFWRIWHKKGNRGLQTLTAASLRNRPIAVTGLLGLDCVHGCHTEIHPVYSLAVPVNPDPNSPIENWAFFLRNWGDEGYCAHQQHFIESEREDGRYTLEIPWRQGMASVEIVRKDTEIFRNWEDSATASVIVWPAEGIFLVIALPKPSRYPRVDGNLILRWKRDDSPKQRSGTGGEYLRRHVKSDDVGDHFSRLRERMSSSDVTGMDRYKPDDQPMSLGDVVYLSASCSLSALRAGY